MLTALVLKDVQILRWRFVFLLLLSLLALMPMPPQAARGALGVLAAHMVVTALLTQAWFLEERSRADLLVALMPVARETVVRARYLVLFGLAGAAASAYTLSVAAIGPFVPAPIAAHVLLQWWLWAAAFTVAFWSLSLPVLFRWGMARGQLALNALMFAPLLLSMGADRLLGPWLRQWVKRGVFHAPDFAIGSAVLAVAVAGLAASASYLVSVRLYGRRDL